MEIKEGITEEAAEKAAETTAEEAAEEAAEAKSVPERADRSSGLAQTLVTILVPVLMLGAFVLFALFSPRTGLFRLSLAALSVIFFGVLSVLLVPRFFAFFRPERIPSPCDKLGERSIKRLHPLLKLALHALAAQLIAYLAIFFADGLVNGVNGTVIEAYPRLFISTRAAEFGQNTRSLIGSLGALSFIMPDHIERLAAGSALLVPIFIVNTLLVCACAVLLYELLIRDYDKRSSKFAVILLLVSPSMLLLLQPLGGFSLFLALSLASLLLARNRRPLFAGLLALAACAANLLAVLLFIPILMEGVRGCILAKASPEAARKPLSAACWGAVLGALLPLLAGGAAVFCRFRLGFGIPAFFEDPHHFFESVGRLADSMAEPSGFGKYVFPALLLLAFAALAFIASRRMRASHAVFMLFHLAAAPALLPVTLTTYSVFSFALLPAAEASVFSRRYLRSLYVFLMLAATLLFIFFLFVRQ